MVTNGDMAIVMAAGKGTRMQSDLPKVLCTARGRPLIDYVLDALEECGIGRIVVVIGYRGDSVRAALADRANVEFVEQTEQLGTGHAVMVCRRQLESHRGGVFILTGDSPMVQVSSLRALLSDFHGRPAACILGTLHSENPAGLGRIVRDSAGQFAAIVEEKDASDAQRRITEVNMSTYLFDSAQLIVALDQLDNQNQQREYYITDCPGILKASGRDVRALAVLERCEGLSVNTLEDLATVESEMQRMGY